MRPARNGGGSQSEREVPHVENIVTRKRVISGAGRGSRAHSLTIAILMLSVISIGLGDKPASGQTWAFEETFDGAPVAPQPFQSSRWDIVAGSNDLDGIVDGQTVDGIPGDGIIESGHGSRCEAPLGAGANNHDLHVDMSLGGFQVNTRPQLVYICNNHLMTVMKAGYGVISLMPRQPFDWAGRTGTFEFEVNAYAFGREWWDIYFVPEDEMLLEIVDRNEGGSGEQMPLRAVKFSFNSGSPQVTIIDGFQTVWSWTSWQRFPNEFPNDPALTDPRIRRTVSLQLSANGWSFAIEKADGTAWKFSGAFPTPLSFTRAQARIEHHAYNPTKDGIAGTPWSQFTYHWDNIRFDGPVVPATPAFEAGAHFVDLMRDPDPNYVSAAVKINVPDAGSGRLVGHLVSMLNNTGTDPQNTSHWRQFRINGGPWQDITLIKNDPMSGDRRWSTFRNTIIAVAGENRVEFRYPLRPPQATWQWNGFRVKDLEIQMPGTIGVPVTPTPPSPTASAVASPSPTAVASPSPTAFASSSPTAVASPTGTTTPPVARVVSFDDRAGQNVVLSGQYPAGVIDWGSARWWLSAPWRSFTTKSVSFNGSGMTSANFTFISPQRLASLRAFNGGSSMSSVTLSCAGQVPVSVNVPAGAVTTIITRWMGTCSTILVGSSNGWDTNFDDLSY
jgi:hypothetical protein